MPLGFLGKPLPLQLKGGFLRLAFFFSLSFGFFRPPLQFLFFGFAFQFLFESNSRLTRFFLFLGSLRSFLGKPLPLQLKRGFLSLAFFLGFTSRFLGKPLPLGFLRLTLPFQLKRGFLRLALFLGLSRAASSASRCRSASSA